jgi:Ca-activated chloride channel family protein
MKNLLIIFVLFIISANLHAQSEAKLIRNGNDLYKNGKYKDAEVSYRKSLEKNKNSYKGQFNLGDALYKQKNYTESSKIFQSLANQDLSKDIKAKAYHNLGNSLLQQKKYEESIEAYKNSLRNKSDDNETKYNLEYAKKKIIQQQQKQQQQQQNKNKDKDKDQKQNQNDQNKDQNKDKQQQQQQNKISKEDAKRMLQAMNNNDKNVQDKLKKVAGNAKSMIEKDW